MRNLLDDIFVLVRYSIVYLRKLFKLVKDVNTNYKVPQLNKYPMQVIIFISNDLINKIFLYFLDSNEDALLIIIENVNILADIIDYLLKYYKLIIISSGQVGYENSLFSLKKAAYILQFIR